VAYTLTITGIGPSPYVFQVQPEFERGITYERDETPTPPVTISEIEQWTLHNAQYVSNTQGSITDDFEALRTILSSRATPIASVVFARDGTPVFQLTTTTHKGGLYARSIAPDHGPGAWAARWKGTIVIVGVRLIDDGSGVIQITKEINTSYDASGLATVRTSGFIRTVPGTSATTKAQAQAIASPGPTFGLITYGPGGSGNVSTLDSPSDTKARYESTWKEAGTPLPAGVNEWLYVQETTTTVEGDVVHLQAEGRGPSMGPIQTAVRAKKPTAGLQDWQEKQDNTAIAFGGSGAVEKTNAASQARTGSSKLASWRIEISIRGEKPTSTERDITVYKVSGSLPYFVETPRDAITVTERIVARLRGPWKDLSDFAADSLVAQQAALKKLPGSTSSSGPTLEKAALDSAGDLWRYEITRVFISQEVSAADVIQYAKEQ
jgi:hypothetical protein